jgi:hypothetical protein
MSWDAARLRAALDSAAYYEERMLTARTFRCSPDLLTYAANLIASDGLVIEVGVASGRTTNLLGNILPNRTVYGFDSFDGLPEDWRTAYSKGHFAGALPEVAPNVSLIKGLFADTLPPFAAEHEAAIALLHVDCDLYSSTATVLACLGDRLRPVSVIVFDEYFNYPGWRRHEFKAFQEFIASSAHTYRYDAFVPVHQQVCVVIE